MDFSFPKSYLKFKDSNILNPQDEQIPLQPIDGQTIPTTETFEHEDESRSFKIGDASNLYITRIYLRAKRCQKPKVYSNYILAKCALPTIQILLESLLSIGSSIPTN